MQKTRKSVKMRDVTKALSTMALVCIVALLIFLAGCNNQAARVLGIADIILAGTAAVIELKWTTTRIEVCTPSRQERKQK